MIGRWFSGSTRSPRRWLCRSLSRNGREDHQRKPGRYHRSGVATQGGSALTFTVLAGVVGGGTSILGGDGAIWRTVVGVLFIALIGNGFVLVGLNPLCEQSTLGVLIILAVGLDAWSRGRAA